MSDGGYNYLKRSQQLYMPITSRAALRAIERGMLPNDAYIFKANSVRPLFEEPIDIMAIEQILAREDSDLSTNQLLIRILEQLLSNRDSETALFAAESINAIENRYNARIESLKKAYGEGKEPSTLRAIAEQFYELGLLNESRKAIKKFYLAESYSYMKEYEQIADYSKEDLIFVIRVMIGLKALTPARNVIAQALRLYSDDAEFLLLVAEVEYSKGNFQRVFSMVNKLKDRWDGLPEHVRQTFQHWMSNGG